jgi:hypothetical protein
MSWKVTWSPASAHWQSASHGTYDPGVVAVALVRRPTDCQSRTVRWSNAAAEVENLTILVYNSDPSRVKTINQLNFRT